MGISLDVPVGQIGEWRVEEFTVTPEQAKFDALRSTFQGGRSTPAGTYLRLMRGGHCIMSNTPDEYRDHLPFQRQAKGRVLINGLGLGMVIEMVIAQVEHLTVVEKSEDVIALSGAHYLAKYPDKLDIVHADAFDYQPPKNARYTAVWHDIWDDICVDNLKDMARLHRKYGRRADWQGSWAREICEYHRRNR